MTKVSLILAFFGGVMSFISPCFLPLLPGYLSWIVGQTPEESSFKEVLFPLISFVLGFSVIFVSLGASASLTGSLLLKNKLLLGRISGVVIILAGLVMLGLLKFPFIYQEKRLFKKPFLKPGSNFVLGMAFALGWTPCIGIILSGILIYASNTGTMLKGILLLSSYSLGLGAALILSGLFFSKLLRAFSFIKRHYRLINYLGGTLLIIMGLLLLFDRFTLVAINIQRLLPNWSFF